ncbi:Fyv7-TAP26 [Babesia duncani]|uniref:Fyv7-TAP26 n=1 Tax=Babesia duncani TaxID=323732 RepID=A0AAD9PJX7_9APIC|nr:Fyv7-TAP26 [Babesia duncani]
MGKGAKVKGYGAYWKGHIKNKTIAQKNKQYIADQRCLHMYRKFKQQDDGLDDMKNTKIQLIEEQHSGDVDDVPVIVPEIKYECLESQDSDGCGVEFDVNSTFDDFKELHNYEKSPNHVEAGKHSVYSKALKKRQVLKKQHESARNERIEEIKRQKREIYGKKRDRYHRYRLLGKFTKRGQPIMANVISHLMHKYKRQNT